jgi:hypothetical protein
MKKTFIGVIIVAILTFVGIGLAAASPGDQASTSIVGVSNSDGTLVTWTITTSGVTDNSTLYLVLLYPSHPAGSTTTLDPAGGGGKELTIDGNGSVSFTESPAPGTNFCGENIDVSVDLLQASDRFAPNPASGGFPFYDLAGSTTVTCVPPTTTTTSTVPATTTTTTVPPATPTTSTTVPAPTTTSTTLVNPQEELKQLVHSDGSTGGKL